MNNSDAPSLRVLTEIGAERERQKSAEGWTIEHDDMHAPGVLARAAACYAYAGSSVHPIFRKRLDPATNPFGSDDFKPVQTLWPWLWGWWKPKTPRADLIRAAALIVAEIERFDRSQASESNRKDGSSPQNQEVSK